MPREREIETEEKEERKHETKKSGVGKDFFKKVLQFEKRCDIILVVVRKITHRGIAQLVEYRSPKPWVAGSNPPAPAKQKKSVAKGSLS